MHVLRESEMRAHPTTNVRAVALLSPTSAPAFKIREDKGEGARLTGEGSSMRIGTD